MANRTPRHFAAAICLAIASLLVMAVGLWDTDPSAKELHVARLRREGTLPSGVVFRPAPYSPRADSPVNPAARSGGQASFPIQIVRLENPLSNANEDGDDLVAVSHRSGLVGRSAAGHESEAQKGRKAWLEISRLNVPVEIQSELALLNEVDELERNFAVAGAETVVLRRNPFVDLIEPAKHSESAAPSKEPQPPRQAKNGDGTSSQPAPNPADASPETVPQVDSGSAAGAGGAERSFPFVFVGQLDNRGLQTLGVEKTGDLTFYSPAVGQIRLLRSPYALGLGGSELYATADLNLDGARDLVVASGGGVTWYLSGPGGLDWAGALDLQGRVASGLVVDDVTQDGRADLIVAFGAEVRIYAASSGRFELVRAFSAEALVGAVATLQGGSGRNDIVVVTRNGGETYYFQNLGNVNFQRIYAPFSWPPSSLGAARWDFQGTEVKTWTIVTGRQVFIGFSVDGHAFHQRIAMDLTGSAPVVVIGDYFSRGEPTFLFYY